MKAKARGAPLIHIDPRFTPASALADRHVALRAGTDIAFLGGVINYILSNGLEFRRVRPGPGASALGVPDPQAALRPLPRRWSSGSAACPRISSSRSAGPPRARPLAPAVSSHEGRGGEPRAARQFVLAALGSRASSAAGADAASRTRQICPGTWRRGHSAVDGDAERAHRPWFLRHGQKPSCQALLWFLAAVRGSGCACRISLLRAWA
jgi:hypothetical protein